MDDTVLIGYVTEVNSENFVIHCDSAIHNQSFDETMDGMIMVENLEDISSIDQKFSENIYMVDSIFSIESDVSHKFSIDRLQYFSFVKLSLYPVGSVKAPKKPAAKPVKTPAKAPVKKPAKKVKQVLPSQQ